MESNSNTNLRGQLEDEEKIKEELRELAYILGYVEGSRFSKYNTAKRLIEKGIPLKDVVEIAQLGDGQLEDILTEMDL